MGIDARFLDRRLPPDTKMFVDYRDKSLADRVSNVLPSTSYPLAGTGRAIETDSSGSYLSSTNLTGSNRFTSDEYNFPDNWPIFPTTQKYAVCLWFYPFNTTNSSYRSIFCRYEGSGQTNTHILAVLQNTRLINVRRIYVTGETSYSTSSGAYTDNQWSHLAYTFDSTRSANNRIKIYLNGVRLATTTGSDSVGTSDGGTAPTQIGASYLQIDGFYGRTAKVQFYFSDLQDQDILDLYNGGR